MWLSRDDILRLAPPSLQKELHGEDSVEDDASPKRIGGVTASPIEHPRCPKCGSTLEPEDKEHVQGLIEKTETWRDILRQVASVLQKEQDGQSNQ